MLMIEETEDNREESDVVIHDINITDVPLRLSSRVSNSITIIASSIIDYFWKNVRIFRLIRLFRLLQKMQWYCSKMSNVGSSSPFFMILQQAYSFHCSNSIILKKWELYIIDRTVFLLNLLSPFLVEILWNWLCSYWVTVTYSQCAKKKK